jgi:alkanesulfonate monooxygenase SsuD/methylene tetrahydromethanopterin reductase-like flavin-dependent oxidoreductase (luciferase family)
MGQSWSKDEHDAVGVSMRERSQRGDEVVQALKAVWDDDPVEYHGQFYQIPRSFVGPKPVQKPHPPIYLAAYTGCAFIENPWTPGTSLHLNAYRDFSCAHVQSYF